MEANIYSAPETELIDEVEVNEEEFFYVVSPKKFWILSIATLNLYSLYWMYKHWATFKAKSGQSMIPFMRAIFSIFFTHSLFAEFDKKAQGKEAYQDWSPNGLATGYVVLSIFDRIFEKTAHHYANTLVIAIVSLAIVILFPYIMYKGQVTANVACDDPKGDSNSSFTAANIVWIILGILLWVLGIAGLSMGAQ